MPPKARESIATHSQAKSKAGAAPPTADAPDASKRTGCPQGAENWTKAQLMVLYNGILKFSPTGQMAWGQIAEYYNEHPSLGAQHDAKSVRQKYQRTLVEARKKPTGDPNIEWRYKVTLKVESELSRRALIRQLDDRHRSAGTSFLKANQSDVDRESKDEGQDNSQDEGGDEEEGHNELSEYERQFGPLRTLQDEDNRAGSAFKLEDDPKADEPEVVAAPEASPRQSSGSSIQEVLPPYMTVLAAPSAPKPAPKATSKTAPKPAPKVAPKPTPKAPPKAPPKAMLGAHGTAQDEPFPTATMKKPAIKGQPSASSASGPPAKPPFQGKGKSKVRASSSEIEYLPPNSVTYSVGKLGPSTSKKREATDQGLDEACEVIRKLNKTTNPNAQEDTIRTHNKGTFINMSVFQLQEKVSGLKKELRDQQKEHERELREERRLHDDERERRIAAENTARPAQPSTGINIETLAVLARMFGSNTTPALAAPVPAAPAPFASGNPMLGALGAVSANIPPIIQQPIWAPTQVQQAPDAHTRSLPIVADSSRARDPTYIPVPPLPTAVGSSEPFSGSLLLHVADQPSDHGITLPAPANNTDPPWTTR